MLRKFHDFVPKYKIRLVDFNEKHVKLEDISFSCNMESRSRTRSQICTSWLNQVQNGRVTRVESHKIVSCRERIGSRRSEMIKIKIMKDFLLLAFFMYTNVDVVNSYLDSTKKIISDSISKCLVNKNCDTSQFFDTNVTRISPNMFVFSVEPNPGWQVSKVFCMMMMTCNWSFWSIQRPK